MTIRLDVTLDHELRTALETGAGLGALRAMLASYRAQGFSAEAVYELLGGLRQDSDDDREDRILELMDIASGFCAPDMRIW